MFGVSERLHRPAPTLSPRDRVIDDVISGLYHGRYRPGQKLLEARLTQRLGVSRGPVREAFNRLAAMGIVSLTPKRGACIRKLSLDDAIDILSLFQDLIAAAAKYSAARCNGPQDVQALQAAWERLAAFPPASNDPGYAFARDEFYVTLGGMAGNAELARVLATMPIYLVRVQFYAPSDKMHARRHGDLKRIVDAVASGSPLRAEAAVRGHFGPMIRLLEAFKGMPFAF